MEAAQKGLQAWVGEKLAAVAAEMREAIENLRIAKEHKWKSAGWQNRVNTLRKFVTFYQKIKEAVVAGYYIVPPFPMDIIAVRTDAMYPPDKYTSEYVDDVERQVQPADALPVGEGDYKSSHTMARYTDFGPVERQADGTKKQVPGFVTGGWKEFDFPFKLVKPQLLESLTEAMKAKIFDQIGIMRPQAAKVDPIILGQILSPNTRRPPVTFFIAWWLDTKDIA